MVLPYIKPINKVAVCADGFQMSVQASHFHYCSPRNDEGPYSTVEVGFPSEQEDLLVPYAEVWKDKGEEVDYTDLVYAYVPSSVVLEVVAKHGGCDVTFLPLLD